MKPQETFFNPTIIDSGQQMKSSEQFWKQFSTNIWEKETLAIKSSFINPPITADELFSIVVNNFNFNINDTSLVSKRFYLQGKEQQLEGSDYYPKPEDGSFTNYDRRIKSVCDNQEYVLIIDGLIVNSSLWDWTYEFLQNLYNSLGYLNCGHYYSIFYGNYRKTPFGVHDHNYPEEPAESAFYFPIEGSKSMRTWKPEFVNRNKKLKDSTQYEEFIEDSTLLEAEASGMLYWPSDRWHIGDSKGGDVSLVIAITNSNNFVEPLAYLLEEEIKVKNLYKSYLQRAFLAKIREIVINSSRRKGKKKAFFDPNNLQKSAETIPNAIQLDAKIFKYFIDSSIVELVCTKLWLSMLTGYGFSPLIPNQFLETSQERLMIDDYIKASNNRQILWREVGKNRIAIAVNGIPTVVPLYRNVEMLIKTINTGEVQSVKSILEESKSLVNQDYQREYSAEGILALLNTLLGNGGIKIVK
jgi:hypothetical protein